MQAVDRTKGIVTFLDQRRVPRLAETETVPRLRDLSERGLLVAAAMDGEARDQMPPPKAER